MHCQLAQSLAIYARNRQDLQQQFAVIQLYKAARVTRRGRTFSRKWRPGQEMSRMATPNASPANRRQARPKSGQEDSKTEEPTCGPERRKLPSPMQIIYRRDRARVYCFFLPSRCARQSCGGDLLALTSRDVVRTSPRRQCF
jgi:hypothetical protein